MLGVRVLEEKDMTITHAISTERLVHVLQSIVLKQQTGRLSIEHFGEQESEKGEIFFAHGDTVFVRTQQEVGEAALSRIMSWRAVQYTFFEEAQTPTGISHQNRAVQRPRQTSPLLPIELERTRQTSPIGIPTLPVDMEETRQTPAIGVPIIPKSIRPSEVRVPTTSAVQQVAECVEKMGQNAVYAVFRALPQATRQYVIYQMERRERVVFLLLDGRRTLRDVARLVHRSELDVARILVSLLKQGYIEYIGS
jgi:hypothetical protein